MTGQIDFKQGILRTSNIRQHLCTFLESTLPALSGRDWWTRRVLRYLKLDQPEPGDWSSLDILALLHIFRENLYDICEEFNQHFTEYNPLVWEMIAIRHTEAHSTGDLLPQDVYRYVDTLERFANFIKNETLLVQMQTAKKSALSALPKNVPRRSQRRNIMKPMDSFITRTTQELRNFFQTVLPDLSTNWGNDRVINELPDRQRQRVQNNRVNTLDKLDPKALFRVLNSNWNDICDYLNRPQNYNYYLVLAMQRVLDTKSKDTEDRYRDLDTLSRFVSTIQGSQHLVDDIQSEKVLLLEEMQKISGSEQKIEQLPLESERKLDGRKSDTTPGEYKQKITTARPGCIVILADQSESMDKLLGNRTKADIVAEAVNTVIAQLITVCTSGEEIKDRCRICVIGYGEEVTYIVNDMVSKLYKPPETGKPIPTWLIPKASNTTPMTEAFELAYQVVQESCSKYKNSFPPVVINITDGVPNDYESTRDAAKKVMELQTTDGNALVFNVHIADSGKEISFPNSRAEFEKEPYAEYAEFLFGISSVLPEPLLDRAQSHGFSPLPDSRCLGYNAKAELLIELLKLGSQPTRKGRRERRPVPRPIANN